MTPSGFRGELFRTRLDSIMTRGIAQGVFPGGVVLVRHANAVVVHEAYGHAVTHEDAHSRLDEKVATQRDTVFDLASITKLFTATCTMQLVAEQHIALDDPVASYLPRFAVNGKAEISIRQLLAHVTGLPNFRLWEDAPTPEARMDVVMAAEPTFPPGTAMLYHDTNFIVLGKLIEVIDERMLDDAVTARMLEPLGLRHTGYGPVDLTTRNVAATEDESYVGRGMVHGDVHDENAWAFGGVAGHAGLFGTAADIGVFGQALLNGGSYGRVELVPAGIAAEMVRNQFVDLGNRGLGWQLDAPHFMGRLASPQTFGHTGFTGTSIVVDPRRDLVVVLLTNRVHPARTGPGVDVVRRAVSDAVLDAWQAESPKSQRRLGE